MKLQKLAVAFAALGATLGVALIGELIGGSCKAPPKEVQGPATPQRDAYFPNTEKLGDAEMRVISCGTGMQVCRRSQASSCFLVELGNGDKFLFHLGTGSTANLASLEIPYDYLDKVFLTHLHSDHFGDFGALYVNGWGGGRQGKLRVWGPTGAKREHGTCHALTKWKEALAWDIDSRLGFSSPAGGELEVNDFDYRAENKVVFQDKVKGVTVRSWPAVHVLDGPVSYSLEWKGLRFVYSGDTVPNTWFVKYGAKAHLAIHECMPTMDMFVQKLHVNPNLAIHVKEIHTLPAAFGAVMNEIKPQ